MEGRQAPHSPALGRMPWLGGVPTAQIYSGFRYPVKGSRCHEVRIHPPLV
jgi:hypothetical protein